MKEVNALSDYVVDIAPIKTGRRVTHAELRWWKKTGDGIGQAERELTFSKVGRKARIDGAGQGADPAPAAPVAAPNEPRPRPAWLDGRGAALRTETYETARLRHPGYDIYFVEGEWRAWAAGKEPAADPDRAFLAFFRKFAETNPL